MLQNKPLLIPDRVFKDEKIEKNEKTHVAILESTHQEDHFGV